MIGHLTKSDKIIVSQKMRNVNTMHELFTILRYYKKVIQQNRCEQGIIKK